MHERRRHVRVKPIAELHAHVVSEVGPLIKEALEIVDISVGGVAIMGRPGDDGVGTKKALQLVLPDGTYAVEAILRWAAKGMMGLEFIDPSDEANKAIHRYIAELLERGG